ncbi:MAG: DUF2877 domain-containing protein [Burkholderiaceae bacterium]
MLQTLKVTGFESTAYAYRGGDIVWLGDDAVTDHPRNGHRPWQPPELHCNPVRLQTGATICLAQLSRTQCKGLLIWLTGQALPFPLNHAQGRFDAIRTALLANDLAAFEAAALRVLGLGHGLTPSGDDCVGGIMFALHLAPRTQWCSAMPGLRSRIRAAAAVSTNVISAALLDDLMQGASYSVLHQLLAALQSKHPPTIEAATTQLLRLGATSGADMLAGLLLALTTTPSDSTQDLPL